MELLKRILDAAQDTFVIQDHACQRLRLKGFRQREVDVS